MPYNTPPTTNIYYLNTLTTNDATDVIIPAKENHKVVVEPTLELLAFTVFGST